MSGKRRSRKEKENRKGIAMERIEILFAQAARFGAWNEGSEGSSRDLYHANRCVDIALAIAMKERVRVPSPYSRLFCRTCHCYFIPTVTVQVRTSRGYVVYRCLECGAVRRYPVARTMSLHKRGYRDSIESIEAKA